MVHINRDGKLKHYELMSRGWIGVAPSKGTYVSIALPVMKQRDFCSIPVAIVRYVLI